MSKAIVYSSPNIVILGQVMEMIRYTNIKGQPGVFESVPWQINPAYDLDE